MIEKDRKSLGWCIIQYYNHSFYVLEFDYFYFISIDCISKFDFNLLYLLLFRALASYEFCMKDSQWLWSWNMVRHNLHDIIALYNAMLSNRTVKSLHFTYSYYLHKCTYFQFYIKCHYVLILTMMRDSSLSLSVCFSFSHILSLTHTCSLSLSLTLPVCLIVFFCVFFLFSWWVRFDRSL